MTTAQPIIFCIFYPCASWQRPLSISSVCETRFRIPPRCCCRPKASNLLGIPARKRSCTGRQRCWHLAVRIRTRWAQQCSAQKCNCLQRRENRCCHVSRQQAITTTGRESLRAELTSWILQTGLSWMKAGGQHCLSGRAVRQDLLPRHMKAIHSIRPIPTLIFKHTFKLSHRLAAASQATLYIIRSVRCWLKIWQRKPPWLVNLSSAVPDPPLRARQPD